MGGSVGFGGVKSHPKKVGVPDFGIHSIEQETIGGFYVAVSK